MTRTVAIGEPTEEMKKVYHIVLELSLIHIYYTDYLDARKAEEKREKTVSAPAEKRRERPSGSKKLKFSYKEQREYENIDGEIAALEEQLAQIRTEQEAKASDYVALQALQSRESELEAALEEKMERWVYLNEDVYKRQDLYQ